jgi:site-specific DNA recombinase
VAYIRVSSTFGKADPLSPTQQMDAIKALAAREGYRIIERLDELDASGGDNTRPKWNAAIQMVERGKARGVVVFNLSRFSRSQVDAIQAIDRLKAAGDFLHSAQEGQFDDSPAGTLLRDTLFRFAQFERDRATEGFRISIDSAVARGIAVMGRVPMGYRRDPDRKLALDPETAPIVVRAFEMRTKGQSHDRIAKWLTEQGYPKNASGVRYLLRNRTYLGEMRSGDAINKNAHPPLISQRLFDQANSRNAKRIVGDGSLTNRVLLQGLLTCEGCDRTLGITSSRYKGEVVPEDVPLVVEFRGGGPGVIVRR